MARMNFGSPGMGMLRPPLAPAMMNELQANPMQQAQKALQGAQPAIPKPPKMPGAPRGPRGPRGARNPFFGE
jgi:hypothetical protein